MRTLDLCQIYSARLPAHPIEDVGHRLIEEPGYREGSELAALECFVLLLVRRVLQREVVEEVGKASVGRLLALAPTDIALEPPRFDGREK